MTLPGFYDTVRTLDQVIDVDYYIPGCPPHAELIIAGAVQALLSGNAAADRARCWPPTWRCARSARASTPSPQDLRSSAFKRPHEILIDEEQLPAGPGPALPGAGHPRRLRRSCASAGNMPCTGCFGPTSQVRDHGGKTCRPWPRCSTPTTRTRSQTALDTIPDPIGTFYRYSLPARCCAGAR